MQAGGLSVTFPLQDVAGKTPDISEYLDFDFYEYVSYKDNGGLDMTAIGRWIGLSHRVIGLMPYSILTQNGNMISIMTVQPLTSL